MTRSRILVLYAAFAMLTAFYPVLQGRLPVPAANALLVLPDGGLPVDRNDELSDVAMQFLPWTHAVADAYRGFRLPFRLASNGCGTPLWANPQAQAVTPTTLPALLLPLPWAAAAAAAVKLFLAAAGAFFFLGCRGATPAASAWAGLAYGFSIHMTAWMLFPDTWPSALLPWSLLALDRLARGQRGGFLAVVSVVFLLLLGGYPETEFFVAVAAAGYFLFALNAQRLASAVARKRFCLAAAAALLALGLTGAYTLPATLALIRSERSEHVARSLETSRPTLNVREIFSPPTYWRVARFWLVPEAQGNPRDQDKFGSYSFAGRASGYAGVLVVAFALAAFFWRSAPRSVVWARRALVGLALYILWYPPLTFLLHATPGLREVAARLTSNRANCIAVLLMALLAALVLDRLLRGDGLRALGAGVGIALAGVILVVIEYAHTSERPPLTAWRTVSFALPILVLLSVLSAMALPARLGRRNVLYAVLLIGTSADLLRIGARFDPGTLPKDYFPVTPAVRDIQAAAHGGRFASAEFTLAGLAYMYGLEDVRVHGVVAPARYVETLQSTVGYTGPAEYPSRVTRIDAPFLTFLDVRGRLDAGNLLRGASAPPAVFPEQLLGVPNSGQLRERLARETDFLRSAFTIGQDETFAGGAELLSFEKPRPEEVRIRVRTDAPRLLAVPETTDGGWRVDGNGAPLTTLTVNGAFLGIRVPGGDTTIVCRYVPPGFRLGLAITGISALLLAGAAFTRTGARSSWRSTAAAAAPPEPTGTGLRSRRRDAAA